MSLIAQSLRQARQQLARSLATPSLSRKYQQWQARFIEDRIRLTLLISMVLLTILAMVNTVVVVPALIRDTSAQSELALEQYQFYPYVFTAQQLGLLLNLILLSQATSITKLKRSFLGYSVAVLLLPQILYMLIGETVFDLGGWILFFMLQAVLIPVRWRWHLISQASLLGIVGVSVLVFQFDVAGVTNEMRQPLYIFLLIVMLCVFSIADFGIYLYERLLMREFELRQQLELFLHAVSHDLRNPVTGTLMLLKNLPAQGGKLLMEQTMVDQMIQGQERQLKLINSLLEAHTQDIRGVVLETESVNLREFLEAIARDFQPQLQQSQSALRVAANFDLPALSADPLHLRRVYDNMIVNALQYNRPGLCITLDAALQGGYVNCTVSDNGQGIPNLQKAGMTDVFATRRVFDCYSRGINRRQPLHLGLGLYICQQIIEAHGGKIGVDSSPGRGTRFWFTVPVR